MKVSVSFYGIQRTVTSTNQIQIPLSRGARVTEVLSYLKECYPELPLSEDTVMITVNNQISSSHQILNAGDRISFIPHLGGG